MFDDPRLAPEVLKPLEEGLILPVSGETEPLVLAHGNSFCATNERGDLAPAGARDLGYFHEDTRHLSHYELWISGGPPVVLSSETTGAATSQIDLTLTDCDFGGHAPDPHNFLHVQRKQLVEGALIEQLTLTSFLRLPVDIWLELRFTADFADIFEVRGWRRNRRGRLLPPEVTRDRLVLRYAGLDGTPYSTVCRMRPAPARLCASAARYELHLQPEAATVIELSFEPERGRDRQTVALGFEPARAELERAKRAFLARTTEVTTTNTLFERTLRHNVEDIDALRVRVGDRWIVAAGIPWFAAPFGRDSLITSLELLSTAPELAQEALSTLALHQGQRIDPWREEEPGKILHELRFGEMARNDEIPHTRYYGTIDATPLWLVILDETLRWSGDGALATALLPNVRRALEWIDARLRSGHGFIHYQRAGDHGLENQGWKDSHDGVSFPDGTPARAPIALVEVQGYAVAAMRAGARILTASGQGVDAARLERSADELAARLDEEFWNDELGYYALALDASGRQVPTITSNPGHLLFCHSISEARAMRVLDVLMSERMYSGWGIRTVASGQAVYNPLSYHNGSVWPHDNALCAFGAARAQRTDVAVRILEGLFDASLHFRRHRLPELFCGMRRREGDYLVHYPVACSPQAWGSGTFFLLLQACLGLEPDAERQRLIIRRPRLPRFLDELELRGLRVGKSSVSLRFARHEARTHADVIDGGGAPLAVDIEIASTW